MSVNSALLAGVSGLVANSTALAAISDNIVNVNTTGYKRKQVNFNDVVTAQSVKGRYSAGGVQAVNRNLVSQQGQLQSTTSSTDVAISGNGFFVVANKSEGLTTTDERFFTRAGSFHVDSKGFLINDAEFYLLGWPIKADGTYDSSPTNLSTLSPINIKNLGGAVAATTNVTINANLNANQVPRADIASYAAGAMADYANDPTTAGAMKPDFTIETTVKDSLGGTHTVAISFLKKDPTVDDPNTWHAEMYTVPIDDIEGGGTIATGTVAFTPDGQLDMAATDLFGGATDPTSIDFGESDGGTAPAWAESLGVLGQTVLFNLQTKNGGLTQFASPSTVDSISSDGATVGNVVGVQVSETGVVSAIFDNNEVRAIAQIALATFPNPDGLTPLSGNAYRASIKSGEFALKAPGEGNAGLISPSSLEASTVDLSAEFTSLITTQRAYSASSKIITTADQMLEELLNIKR